MADQNTHVLENKDSGSNSALIAGIFLVSLVIVFILLFGRSLTNSLTQRDQVVPNQTPDQIETNTNQGEGRGGEGGDVNIEAPNVPENLNVDVNWQ